MKNEAGTERRITYMYIYIYIYNVIIYIMYAIYLHIIHIYAYIYTHTYTHTDSIYGTERRVTCTTLSKKSTSLDLFIAPRTLDRPASVAFALGSAPSASVFALLYH